MSESSPTGVPHPQPGLVCVLAESTTHGSPGPVFVRTLKRSLGDAPTVAILDLAELRRAGLPGKSAGALDRLRFENEIASRAAECLRAAEGAEATRSRFLVVIVAFLNELVARQHAVALLPLVEGALRRIAFPRSVEPSIVGIHLLPDRWTALEGASLFAWLKEFHYALRLSATGQVPARSYAMAAAIGRSDTDSAGTGHRLGYGEDEMASAAAEFVAASLHCRVLDEVLAARRGRKRQARFDAFGIEPLNGDDSFDEAVARSRVLWPVAPLARPGTSGGLLQAVAGRSDPPSGWTSVDGCETDGSPAWAIQVASGLSATDTIGAEVWRSHYLTLSAEERREIHGIPAAVDWPDPFDDHARQPAQGESGAPPFQL